MGTWKAPDDLKYSKTDEWLRVEGDTGTIGITDYAQDQLNDIVFVELPQVGAKFGQDDVFGVVESVKAASDVHMPVAGTITEVNSSVEDTPETINSEPYDAAWLVKIKLDDPAGVGDLMDVAAYEKYCDER